MRVDWYCLGTYLTMFGMLIPIVAVLARWGPLSESGLGLYAMFLVLLPLSVGYVGLAIAQEVKPAGLWPVRFRSKDAEPE